MLNFCLWANQKCFLLAKGQQAYFVPLIFRINACPFHGSGGFMYLEKSIPSDSNADLMLINFLPQLLWQIINGKCSKSSVNNLFVLCDFYIVQHFFDIGSIFPIFKSSHTRYSECSFFRYTASSRNKAPSRS